MKFLSLFDFRTTRGRLRSFSKLFLVVIAVSACTAKTQSEVDTLTHLERAVHMVTVDPEGAPLDPTTYDVLSKKGYEAQLQAITDAITKSGKTKILIFVHGGLNHHDASQARVDRLLKPMEDSGYFPVFLNWNSSLIDTAGEDLLFIRQGRKANYLGPLSSPFAVVAALGTGLVRAPMVWGQLLSSDLNATDIETLSFPGKRNAKILTDRLVSLYREHDSNAIPIVSPPEPHVDKWDSTLSALRYFATIPTKLLSAPIIDGVGQGAWRNMLRRTELLFHREEQFDIRDFRQDKNKIDNLLRGGPQGAAYLLFSHLEKYIQKSNVEITLIGHSMGAIVLNRALREFPKLSVADIVYLAAACSIDDFRTSVVPYLQAQTNARFVSLMLHPLQKAANGRRHFWTCHQGEACWYGSTIF